jgi:NitT/TauT family transport system permease protein/taurine transport system permease protein
MADGGRLAPAGAMREDATLAALAPIGAEQWPAERDTAPREAFWVRRQRYVVGFLSVSGLLVAWELIARLFIRDPAVLPSPSQTLYLCVQHFIVPYPAQSETLLGHALISLIRICVGFVAGSIVGVGLGAAMAASRMTRYAIDPIIELLRPLPPLAFIPLLVVWFGIDELPKVVLIFIGVVPVMIIATLAGLDGVPRQLVDVAMALGASRRYAMLHVRIRAALVPIVTGMRVAVGVSWTSIVAAEMIAATRGIGYVILEAGNYLDTAMVFAAILMIGLIGLLMDRGLRLVLRALDPTA